MKTQTYGLSEQEWSVALYTPPHAGSDDGSKAYILERWNSVAFDPSTAYKICLCSGFPKDGSYSWETPNAKMSRVRYDEGPNDKKWMLQQDIKYIKDLAQRELLKEKESEILQICQRKQTEKSCAIPEISQHYKVEVDTTDDKGDSALHVAARDGKTAAVIALLKAHASPSIINNAGYTPLRLASVRGHEEIVIALLKAGASPLEVDKEGWTPLHLAAFNGHEATAALLIATDKLCLQARDDEGRTPLHRASNLGHFGIVEILLNCGAAIESKDDKSKTPLHSAVSRRGIDNEKVIRLLVERKANLEADTSLGWTPLHSACRYGEPETAELLLILGAKIEARNNYGETPLNMVVSDDNMMLQQKIKIAELLLRNGANINTQDSAGRTPLHWACIKNLPDLANLLIKLKADVTACDHSKKIPLHYAETEEIVKLLITHANAKKSKQAVAVLNDPAMISLGTAVTPSFFTKLKRHDDTVPIPTCKPIALPATVEKNGEMEEIDHIQLIKQQQKQIKELQHLVQTQALLIEQLRKEQNNIRQNVANLTSKLLPVSNYNVST